MCVITLAYFHICKEFHIRKKGRLGMNLLCVKERRKHIELVGKELVGKRICNYYHMINFKEEIAHLAFHGSKLLA